MSGAFHAVIIAGYGQMGHAMESLLAGRARLGIWPIVPDDLELPAHIAAQAGMAELLLICTPTLAHAAVLERLAPRLSADAAVLSIAKGLDETGRCAADVLQAYRGGGPWGVLGGPMIANEIISRRPAFAELGSRDQALPGQLRALYPRAALQITDTADPVAVSWCGVLKNIYAPLVGVSDELGWGDNARGHIVMCALREMRAILQERAGEHADAYGDAGLADFVTTVTSPSSHHHAVGRRVARDDHRDLRCEGLHSLQVLKAGGKLDAGKHVLLGVAALLAGEPARLPKALHDWLTAG